jgi:hypothetical protein
MKNLSSLKILILLPFVISLVLIASCKKEEEEEPINNTGSSLTITIGVFTKSGSVYTATGKELIFDSKEECQTWSRNAPGDVHNSSSHLHYNAAANVSFVSSDSSFSWTEYGPELDQSSIDATCTAAVSGVNKTVNTTSYFSDKNTYLKITKVE